MPASIASELKRLRVDFQVDNDATGSGQSVCFLTNHGWSSCTALNASGMAGELASLPILVPSNGWVEAFLVEEPTYEHLGDPTKRVSLGRIESDSLGDASSGAIGSGRVTLDLANWNAIKDVEGESRFSISGTEPTEE